MTFKIFNTRFVIAMRTKSGLKMCVWENNNFGNGVRVILTPVLGITILNS